MTISVHQSRPFNVRYVVWNTINRRGEDMRSTHRTAKASYLYINRQNGIDDVGPTPNWAARQDLIASGRVGPARANDPALAGVGLWEQTDLLARQIRPTEATLAHAIGSLPLHESPVTWRQMIEGFAEDHLVSQGMVCDFAIHAQEEGEGQRAILPHAHLLITTRVYDRSHSALGRRRQAWLRTPAACRSLADKWYDLVGIYPPVMGMSLPRAA